MGAGEALADDCVMGRLGIISGASNGTTTGVDSVFRVVLRLEV